uniref:Uncharacterized protein n=1 Tax=Anguilla anguilla TaxID=7936 RepID=A0A0E9SFB2_ANGAN
MPAMPNARLSELGARVPQQAFPGNMDCHECPRLESVE